MARRFITVNRLRGTSLRRSHRASCLEAFPAKHRASLSRPEGNRGFLAALRARCLRFRSRLVSSSPAFRPFRLTGFASFRFVLKSLVGEKHLLAGSKHKLGTALRALQYLVVEFHEPLPLDPFWAAGTDSFVHGAFLGLQTCTPGSPGTDPLGQRAKNLNDFPTSLPERGLIPEARRRAASRAGLILLATLLLAQSLPRKRFFGPALLAGLHVEAVLLYFLNDVFLLHLALETAQRILKRLTLLDDYLCQ